MNAVGRHDVYVGQDPTEGADLRHPVIPGSPQQGEQGMRERWFAAQAPRHPFPTPPTRPPACPSARCRPCTDTPAGLHARAFPSGGGRWAVGCSWAVLAATGFCRSGRGGAWFVRARYGHHCTVVQDPQPLGEGCQRTAKRGINPATCWAGLAAWHLAWCAPLFWLGSHSYKIPLY